MKRFTAAALAAVFVLALGVQEAAARSAARLRWEGAAIALGTLGFLAVLGEAARAQEGRIVVEAPPDRYGYDEYPYEGPAAEAPYGPPPPPPDTRPYGEMAPPPPPPEAGTYGAVAPPPPPPAPGKVWVPGYWVETEVWVPLTWGLVWVWDDEGRDRRWRYDRHRDHRSYRSGRYERRPLGGHFERRRTWRDGYYRDGRR